MAMTMSNQMTKVVLALVMLAGKGAFGGTDATGGTIRGTVYTSGPSGEQFGVPGAHVKLSGPASFDILANEAGSYSLSDVPPGAYSIEVTAPDLIGSAAATIVAGDTTDANVRLEIESVKTWVGVTDNAPPISTESVGRDVIGERTLQNAPNKEERFDSTLPLIPGVVRGPDGLMNMKGARASQGGSLLNGANATDPVTGIPSIRLPIDVVSSVEVISNPYDPEYGKLTGAVAKTETRTGDYEGFHVSIQNILPRPRKRAGDYIGIESFTPRLTVTGPLIKDKVAFTQSVEYRYVRTGISTQPPLERDTKLESFNSFSQVDWIINTTQSLTASFANYPQKLDYLGLNTFTPQEATPDLHQRAYMASIQHRWATGPESMLVSQFSYKRSDADVTAQSDDPYRLFVETTEGGYFNRQHLEAYRTELQETYQFAPVSLWGSHQIKTGFNYSHNNYDGRTTDLPVNIVGISGYTVEHIQFGPTSNYSVDQNEISWFVADKWAPFRRVTINYGVRLDRDSVTSETNVAPRAGVAIALTRDNRTLLKAGGGLFYDRVPLNIPVFPLLPGRTITDFDAFNNPLTSTHYVNVLGGDLQNPRSTAWNVELDRQVLERLVVRVAYQQRNTSRDFVVTPKNESENSVLELSNGGFSNYREFQVTGRYQLGKHVLNASYVRSKAFGDLNDFNQFFGNTQQVVIQPNDRGRLPFDAPNRWLFWGEFAAPYHITVSPTVDVHTGFPYSVQDQERQYIGPRNVQRLPTFNSVDLQLYKRIALPFVGKKARVGFGVFNILNHFNPRDVQNILESDRFGGYFNGVGRTFRGKFVLEF
jgi:hypothetical protein